MTLPTRTAVLLLAILAAGAPAGGEPRRDRPVGDDKTDLAPLDQTPRPQQEDRNNLAPGSADQGGGVPDAAQQHR